MEYQMTKVKNSVTKLKRKNDIKINFLPVYESKILFQERKEIVQQFIVKMILLGSKRGRPSHKEMEEVSNAA